MIGTMHRVDTMGRLVLPKEIREFYHINTNDTIEIIPTVDGILIRKPAYKVVKIDDVKTTTKTKCKK